MAIASLFGSGKSPSCIMCGDLLGYPSMSQSRNMCSFCEASMMMQMQKAMQQPPNLMQQLGQQLGGLNGQYWGASTPLYSGAAGPTYTGLGGTMHPAAHFPNAFGAGTRNLPIENAGIRAGEIIAFRCWVLTKQAIVEGHHHLRSTYADCTWRPGEVVGLDPEACPEWPAYAAFEGPDKLEERRKRYLRLDPHDQDGVRTGIHGFKSASWMMMEFSPSHDPRIDKYLIYGTAALWGDVIEHQEGFRAEFGKINTLDQIDAGLGHEETLDKLRKLYGVEGKSYRDFKIGV